MLIRGMSGCWIDRVLHRRKFFRQDPHSAPFCEEIKTPLQEQKQAIGESNKEINMYASPDKPCQETRKTRESQIRHRIRSADDCEIALIPIPERFRLCASRYTATNDVRNVLTLLYCGLRHSGQEHWCS